MLPKRQD